MVVFHPTRLHARMITTRFGMRRVLKRPENVIDFLRKAVETGVYRTPAEIEQILKNGDGDQESVCIGRLRQDFVRGSTIFDYPKFYTLMKMTPPIPDPLNIPNRIRKKMKELENPAEAFIEKQLHREVHRQINGGRNKNKHQSAKHQKPILSPKEYYQRLFGLGTPALSPMSTIMGQKSASVQIAYAKAVKQFQLQRTQGLSEEEAIRQVDELLAEENIKERKQSRVRANKAVKEFKDKTPQQRREEMRKVKRLFRENLIEEKLEYNLSPKFSSSSSRVSPSPSSSSSSNDTEEQQQSEPKKESPSNSIFADNPLAAEALMKWSERLMKVPYEQWTVGASTALDHWIARQVLCMSELTWQQLLEGQDPALLGRGRDIIRVRESLFPETTMRDDKFNAKKKPPPTQAEWLTERERSIDQLLANLGNYSNADENDRSMNPPPDDYAASHSSSSNTSSNSSTSGRRHPHPFDDLDARIEKVVNELQGWRRLNMKTPYSDWSEQEHKIFKKWINKYVATVSNRNFYADNNAATTTVAETKKTVTKDEFRLLREALLAQPPISKDDSDFFWSQLQDEEDVANLLDTIKADGQPPPGASFLKEAFWELPYQVQLERLLNMGALRPLLDEHTKESDRIRFLQRYGDTILTGVEMDHLVEDPDGPIKAWEIPSSSSSSFSSEMSTRSSERGERQAMDKRYQLVRFPYRASTHLSSDENVHMLLTGWNEHKASRARYEEELFRSSRLGLEYGDDIENYDQEEDDID